MQMLAKIRDDAQVALYRPQFIEDTRTCMGATPGKLPTA